MKKLLLVLTLLTACGPEDEDSPADYLQQDPAATPTSDGRVDADELPVPSIAPDQSSDGLQTVSQGTSNLKLMNMDLKLDDLPSPASDDSSSN